MELLSRTRTKQWSNLIILISLFTLALVGLLRASLSRLHLGMSSDWASLLFYFLTPAALWMVTIPLIRNISKMSFELTVGALSKHLVIGLLVCFCFALVSLSVDFYLRKVLGLAFGSIIDFFLEVRYLVVDNILTNSIIYFLILTFLRYTNKITTSAGHDLDKSVSITVKSSSGVDKINLDDIILVEAFGNYVKIHRTSNNFVCIRSTLKELEDKLRRPDFNRTHRSFIINTRYLQSIQNGHRGACHLVLSNGMSVPATGAYKRSIVKNFRSAGIR